MSKSTHFMQLKQINVDAVKDALKANDYSTKNSIAQETGLSIATCGNILSELLASGEAKEIDLDASSGGRPARRFVFNKDFTHVATVYFRREGDQDSMVMTVSNLVEEVVYEKSIERTSFDLPQIEDHIQQILTRFPKISVLALGIPGVVHKGQVGYSHFDALNQVPLEAHLQAKFDVKIILENDMNATALGFYHSYAKETPETIAYVYFPKDNISGAGIIVEGNILRGHTNFAGEVSYLPLGLDYPAQRAVQQDPDAFSTFVVGMIASINGVINPQRVVLSGYYFKEALNRQIQDKLEASIPHPHVPDLLYEADIHVNYIRGLTALALDQLRASIKIVQR